METKRNFFLHDAGAPAAGAGAATGPLTPVGDAAGGAGSAAGGGRAAGTLPAASAAAGQTKEAAPAAAPDKTKEAAPAAGRPRGTDYDRYQLSDAERAEADRLLDGFDRLDHTQRAALIRSGVEAERARQGAQPAGKTPPAEPAGEIEDPRDKEIRLLKEKDAERTRREGETAAMARAREQREQWQTEVVAELKDNAALAEFVEDPVDARALAAEAMGYVADNLGEHGNSRAKALKAWTNQVVKRLAKARGMGVTDFLESKVKARAAQTETGGGRPPAQTTTPPTPADLVSGKILEAVARTAGVDLNAG